MKVLILSGLLGMVSCGQEPVGSVKLYRVVKPMRSLYKKATSIVTSRSAVRNSLKVGHTGKVDQEHIVEGVNAELTRLILKEKNKEKHQLIDILNDYSRIVSAGGIGKPRTLNLDPTEKEVQKTVRQLQSVYHPDKLYGPEYELSVKEESVEVIRHINAIRERLIELIQKENEVVVLKANEPLKR